MSELANPKFDAVVTGGAGFVGSHLVDFLLDRGSSVTVVDNFSTGRAANLGHRVGGSSLKIIKADLRRTVRIPSAARYFHLASPASPAAYQDDPIGTLQVNSFGFEQVLEAGRKHDAAIVLASTSEIYGDPEVHPQAEWYWGHVNPIGPRSCYDEGKRYAEALGTAFRRKYGLDVRIARIFNTYGPRMDPDDGRVVSNFISQALEGKALTVYGTGTQTRSFCYVSDLVRGLSQLMEAQEIEGPVNLGNPGEVSVRRLAEIVAKIAKVPLITETHELPTDDPKRRCPDIGRAVRELAWTPEVPLEEGLRRTMEYLRSLRPRGPRGAL
ncbi:MAG: GDP-mannose 4,6-dehydratase [Thermoplasmata archaeon]|nr:GDP-mannose 4,6-dehydratase [Thermoplasmata archaeon]